MGNTKIENYTIDFTGLSELSGINEERVQNSVKSWGINLSDLLSRMVAIMSNNAKYILKFLKDF
jgi:hypothetical protein